MHILVTKPDDNGKRTVELVYKTDAEKAIVDRIERANVCVDFPNAPEYEFGIEIELKEQDHG